MMKYIALFLLFCCVISARGDLSTGQVSIFDSAGNTLDSSDGSLHVKSRGATGSLSNNAGQTDVTPGVYTLIFATNSARKYLLIQNTDPVGKLYVDFNSPAIASSIVLLPGGSFVMEGNFIDTEDVYVASDISVSNYMSKEGQ